MANLVRRICKLLHAQLYWVVLFAVYVTSMFFGVMDTPWFWLLMGWIFVSVAVKSIFVARELKRRK